jgi:hypothetical protein
MTTEPEKTPATITPPEAAKRVLRQRNIVTLLLIVAFVVLVYVVSIVRMKGL